MYSSSISAPIVEVCSSNSNTLMCIIPYPLGSAFFSGMELYPVDYWYQYNVDGFGKTHYNEWDAFWFSGTLDGWSM